ncbi:hypothetical protein [Burkholderia aenigmatica]|nr:hypothetical protein [Burkholderia aenigmatica]
MFDDLKFRHVMPDGYAGENYQTKDLRFGMDMANYEIDSLGRLIRTASDFGQPLGDVRFNYTLTIDATDARHTYALAFTDGFLRTIHCFQTGRTVPFQAAA